FEAGQLNNQGQVIFTADVDTGGEGVFLGSSGGFTPIMRGGEPAPGGGTFGGFGSLSTHTSKHSGDPALGFSLNPFTLPVNVNAGVYRYNHSNGSLSAVLVPFVTPAPGGDIFQGSGFHPNLNNNGDLVFPGIIHSSIGPAASLGLGEGIFLADKQ